jgi:hypothetical protein
LDWDAKSTVKNMNRFIFLLKIGAVREDQSQERRIKEGIAE